MHVAACRPFKAIVRHKKQIEKKKTRKIMKAINTTDEKSNNPFGRSYTYWMQSNSNKTKYMCIIHCNTILYLLIKTLYILYIYIYIVDKNINSSKFTMQHWTHFFLAFSFLLLLLFHHHFKMFCRSFVSWKPKQSNKTSIASNISRETGNSHEDSFVCHRFYFFFYEKKEKHKMTIKQK